jgi:hypothetical protein
MEEDMKPKVFMSHASEDKDRFVLEFATKLREKGVDVWLDKWEMLPGDSIVEKIFDEGLKDAEAIIIVLSEISVNKPWVKEELNTSIVNRISKGTRIIPIVLDNCDVPECLQSTLWEKIENLKSYEKNLNRVLSSIFGHTDKPEIGNPPNYVDFDINEIDGLTKTDNIVLKQICEYSIETGTDILSPVEVFKDFNLDISREEIDESIQILSQYGYLKMTKYLGGGYHFNITLSGFDLYLKAYYEDYESTLRKIISALVNNDARSISDIRGKIDVSKMIINHFLELLDLNDHIRLTKTLGGSFISSVSPSLKRLLI